MKPFLFIAAISAMALASCHKDAVNPNNNVISIVGNWNLVSDSTWNVGMPTGIPHIYKGVAGDYFKFTNSGKQYVKEGSIVLDTADYTVSKDTLKLKYDYLNEGGEIITGTTGSYIITQPNSHEIELNDVVFTLDAAGYERIILSK